MAIPDDWIISYNTRFVVSMVVMGRLEGSGQVYNFDLAGDVGGRSGMVYVFVARCGDGVVDLVVGDASGRGVGVGIAWRFLVAICSGFLCVAVN